MPHTRHWKRTSTLASATAVLIVAVFVAALSVLTWRAEYAQQVAYLGTLANISERSLDTYFLQTRSALLLLSQEIAEHDEYREPHSARTRLEEFQRNFPGISTLTLIRPDGQTLASTRSAPGAPMPSLKGEAHFDESMAEFRRGMDFSISRPFFGAFSREWLVALRTVVRDTRGEPRFIVAGALPLVRAQGFWSESPVPPGVVLGIIRDDGYLLVRHPTPPGVSNDELYANRRSGALYDHLRATQFPETGVVSGISSSSLEDTLTAFRRFKHFPLTFRVSVPMRNVWESWWAAILPIYGLVAVLLVALVVVNVWLTRLQRDLARGNARQIAALEAANSELTRANAELDGFSYTVAHDLRAPVRALDGFAGMLGQDHGHALDADGRALLVRIRGATARMDALINGMLSFARLSRNEIKSQQVDTAALVDAVALDIFPPEARAQLVVGALPASQADPVMLRAVWFNLLANAFKFSRGAAAPKIEVGFERGAFFVRDNGAGFDMAHSHNLFGVFSRLHAPAQFEGTGIGLAIVKRIVERHGGRVEAHGEVGRGAEFRFSLGTVPAP